jgi:IS30 family transposase
VWLRALTKKSSEHVKTELKDVFESFGFPQIVQHDQGTEFGGKVKDFLEGNGIHNIISSPYHPQSRGKVERSHRSLKRLLSYDLYKKRELNWPKHLYRYQNILNDCPKDVLGWLTPFVAFLGERNRELKRGSRCILKISVPKFSKPLKGLILELFAHLRKN